MKLKKVSFRANSIPGEKEDHIVNSSREPRNPNVYVPD